MNPATDSIPNGLSNNYSYSQILYQFNQNWFNHTSHPEPFSLTVAQLLGGGSKTKLPGSESRVALLKAT
jgi:hypothetical protein